MRPPASRSASRVEAGRRDAGALFFELLLGITVLAVGILGYLGSFVSNARAARATGELDQAAAALANVAEHLRGVPLADLHANYDGWTFEVPDLVDPDGGSAFILVRTFVDETAVPPGFGPVTDLDGDPEEQSTDVSADYELLPVLLRLDFAASDGTRSSLVYLVLGSD